MKLQHRETLVVRVASRKNLRTRNMEISPRGDIISRGPSMGGFCTRLSLLDSRTPRNLILSPVFSIVNSSGKTTSNLLEMAVLEQAAECLRILAHPHRLRIVQMLLAGRYTVGELADACGIKSHMASEHLRLMQRCGFLDSEKEGRKTFYRLAEPHLADIMACIESRFGRN